MILTCVESKDTEKIKLQSIDIKCLTIDQVNEADIFYWQINLINHEKCKDNIKISESGEVYIKQSYIDQYRDVLSEGVYYITEKINKNQINKKYNYDIIFRVDKENKINKMLEIVDCCNEFIVFIPNYEITEDITKDQKLHIKELKKVERIRSYFYKVLNKEEIQSKLKNRGKIIEQEKFKKIDRIIKDTQNSDTLYYNRDLEEELELILDEYGIGINSLSFHMYRINPSLFPIYSEDMSKYLVYHNIIEDNKQPRLYLDYCRYLSNIINQSCKFKLGLYNLESKGDETFYQNQINTINFYLYNRFSILDLM